MVTCLRTKYTCYILYLELQILPMPSHLNSIHLDATPFLMDASSSSVSLIRYKDGYNIWSPSKNQVRDGEEVYCLEVAVFYHDDEHMGKCLCYLILRCINSQDQVYERIEFSSQEGWRRRNISRTISGRRKLPLCDLG